MAFKLSTLVILGLALAQYAVIEDTEAKGVPAPRKKLLQGFRKVGRAVNDTDAMYDAKHGIKMGIPSGGCDDAKTNLEVDWDGSAIAYTCFTPNKPLMPDYRLEPRQQCQHLPQDYYPQHHCMNEQLRYKEAIPTHGDHRPLWPVFGEYKYVPPQRWLHNIEHGSVVMLYHPCAHHTMVDQLRGILNACIRKRIITPYDKLSEERPLALVAWGCKLEMAFVDEKRVAQFIREKALKGPEGTYAKQGQYSFALKVPAQAVDGSDINDSVLCPNI